MHNTTRALDLAAATYAFGADRGFRYKPARAGGDAGTPGGVSAALWPWVGTAAGFAAGLPTLAGRPGGVDPRAYAVIVLGVPLCVCFAPALAIGLSNHRRLTAHEREIGRETTNR